MDSTYLDTVGGLMLFRIRVFPISRIFLVKWDPSKTNKGPKLKKLTSYEYIYGCSLHCSVMRNSLILLYFHLHTSVIGREMS